MDAKLNQAIQNLVAKNSHSSSKNKQFIPKPYKDVAAGMEKQFVQFMLEQMKKTSPNGQPSSTGMDYYKSLLTNKQSENIVARDNIGMQDLILDQIYPKRMRSEIAYRQYEKQQNFKNQRRNNIVMHDHPKNVDQNERSVNGSIDSVQEVKND